MALSEGKPMTSRRNFLKHGMWGLAGTPLLKNVLNAGQTEKKGLIKPPALNLGDTIGLIAPASPLIETQRTLIEVKEKLTNLGFSVLAGKNVTQKNGYLAGSVKDRLADIHYMFENNEVKAVMAMRGGYGSAQLLPFLDYELIRKQPKILIGYSDITALITAIHKITGLVTFHGPVAVSTFTDYTKKYFFKVMTEKNADLEIEDAPYEENLQTSNRIWCFRKGIAEGKLMGGNLTLLQASLGTPFEIDTQGAILFIEEVGEAPYDLDRILNQFKQAGKFDHCRGVIFDKLEKILPYSSEPGFNNSLSVEEVIESVFKDFDFPVCLGFSIGHIKNKPTLPIGIRVRLSAEIGRLTLLESAVS